MKRVQKYEKKNSASYLKKCLRLDQNGDNFQIRKVMLVWYSDMKSLR